MKENSIEEDIVLLKEMQQNCLTKKEYKDSKANKKAKAIEHILSEYQRVLKENELAKQTLIKNCNIADERNQLLKENEKKDELIERMKRFLLKENKMRDYLDYQEGEG